MEEVEHFDILEPSEPWGQLFPASTPGPRCRVGQAEQVEGGGNWRCGKA